MNYIKCQNFACLLVDYGRYDPLKELLTLAFLSKKGRVSDKRSYLMSILDVTA